ncbi:hypothetical protein LTR47_006061 [Exophiala xenobiotica]|nr:hypothetical protein LTR72_009602 [Exophiala xenobiotica]KAK5232834.1 hypothetical protein LTR47_006061 [Exophiala xenobiotica]KAK5255428.1 hypothetical protein LTS06_000449 [Exophiala xenobiotica]KAK5287926.1 hypothetical protein LTR14_008709 [Exophiala xenobiotica]KAK5316740.1 hypothetical protein LTR93_009052 [Exophiala xenobiotica]
MALNGLRLRDAFAFLIPVFSQDTNRQALSTFQYCLLQSLRPFFEVDKKLLRTPLASMSSRKRKVTSPILPSRRSPRPSPSQPSQPPQPALHAFHPRSILAPVYQTQEPRGAGLEYGFDPPPMAASPNATANSYLAVQAEYARNASNEASRSNETQIADTQSHAGYMPGTAHTEASAQPASNVLSTQVVQGPDLRSWVQQAAYHTTYPDLATYPRINRANESNLFDLYFSNALMNGNVPPADYTATGNDFTAYHPSSRPNDWPDDGSMAYPNPAAVAALLNGRQYPAAPNPPVYAQAMPPQRPQPDNTASQRQMDPSGRFVLPMRPASAAPRPWVAARSQKPGINSNTRHSGSTPSVPR